MSNGSSNALHLLELLIGSSQEVKKRDKSRKSISKLELIIEGLRNDIRDQIDANLPVFYLVNSEVIVKAMLKALTPENLFTTAEKGNLVFFKYFTGLNYNGNAWDINNTIIEKEIVGFGSVKKVKEIDPKFIEAYKELYKKIEAKAENIKKDIVKKVNSAITNSTGIIDVSNDINQINIELVNELERVSTSSSYRSSRITRVGRLMREKFQSRGVSVISDPQTMLANYSADIHVLVVGANYTNTTSQVHAAATKAIIEGLPTNSLKPTSEFKAGNFAAAGHSGLRSKSKLIGINTPLLQIVSLILSQYKKTDPNLFSNFVLNTGHDNYTIQINENFQFQGNALYSIGISMLQSMESEYNTVTLGQQEQKEASRALKAAGITKSYRQLKEDLTKVFNKGSTLQHIVTTFRMSPTLKESLKYLVVDTLNGKGYTGLVKSANAKKSGKSEKRNIKSGRKSTSKIQAPNPSINVGARSTYTRSTYIATNLTSLLNQINGLLQEQIKRNMGTGNRRDVLNYETGRFADSVKVERLSESREGMITAFYSYMKNPYATFSKGGRQERPASRDPKLLISKSIREIAQAQVANRMRAVNV